MLNEDEYYHGTHSASALQIMHEGYRFKKFWSGWGKGGQFKTAVYITKSPETAALFGRCIFKCKLNKSVRMLRLDEDYDPNIIKSLKREFGKTLLTGDISKAIPRNKHLKTKELIHLLNYRFVKAGGSTGRWTMKTIVKWRSTISSVKQQVLLHKYDAIGEDQTEIGIAVFNPSFIQVVDLYRAVYSSEQKKRILIELDKKLFAAEIKNDIDEYKSWEEYDIDCDHLTELLKRYCDENSLSIDISDK